MTDFITYSVEELSEDFMKNQGFMVVFSTSGACLQLFSEYHPKRLSGELTVDEVKTIINDFLSATSIPLGIEDPDVTFDFSLYLSLDSKTWIKKLDSNEKEEIGKAGFEQNEYPHMLIINNRAKEKQYFHRNMH